MDGPVHHTVTPWSCFVGDFVGGNSAEKIGFVWLREVGMGYDIYWQTKNPNCHTLELELHCCPTPLQCSLLSVARELSPLHYCLLCTAIVLVLLLAVWELLHRALALLLAVRAAPIVHKPMPPLLLLVVLPAAIA
jgi:hypothetical protein